MDERLNEALDQIRDGHIAEAAEFKRRKRPYWLGALAAVLAIAIAWTAIWRGPGRSAPDIILQDPATPSAATTPSTPFAPDPPPTGEPDTPMEDTPQPEPTDPIAVSLAKLASPVYPERVTHPALPDGGSWKDYYAQFDQPEDYADGLEEFLRESIAAVLSDDSGKNRTYSPLNVYMALAMLAEVSQGSSRQQILELLGCGSIEALRTQVGHLWNAHYRADGANASLLANSLWLDSGSPYVQSTVDGLAESYYASVFHGDLGTEGMNEALRDWLNAQTDGLLEDAVKDVKLDPQTVFALASTVYYRAKWQDGFNEEMDTQDLFHTASGDTTVTYMHRTLKGKRLYQGDGYRAIALELEDDSRMWLILPDEGSSPQELLAQGDCLDLILGDAPGYVTADVVLSLPKFDIASKQDLKAQLKDLGVTAVFSSDTADFSPLTGQTGGICVDKVEHAARVAIDEEGVTAAAYTVIDAPTSGIPQELEKIEFTLDRPFLFAITSQDDLPLFTGIVERP